MARPGSTAAWLLRTVEGRGPFARGEAEHVRGLEARDGEIIVRLDRPTPDLPERVAHPALVVWREVDPGAVDGSGPFRFGGDGHELLAREEGHRSRPRLDRIELRSEGSFIDAEFLVRARNAGARIIQMGVDYFPRSRGRSTLASPGVILGILGEMARLAPGLWWRTRLPAPAPRGQ